MQDQWNKVDAYITELLVQPDEALELALEDSKAGGLPAISVSQPQGKLLGLLARAIGAKRILEIGTLGGYSGICLARALPPDGRLVTLEINPKHADVARRNFARAGLSHAIDLRLGAAIDLLPKLAAEQGAPFDLTFIDADKPGYTEYLEWAIRLSRPGSVIVADNVVRDGHIIDEESSDAMVQGARRFNAALAADTRVSATAIQTVGQKGYDGFAVAVVL